MALPRLAPDQAEGLRRLFVPDVRRMVALVSIGDSGADLAARIAAVLAAQGSRVLLLDEFLTAGQHHAECAATPQHDLDSVLHGAIMVDQAVVQTACGVHLLAGGSRARPRSRPGMEAYIGLINSFYRLAGLYDVVLVNTPGDALQSRPGFAWACQDVIVQCGNAPDAAKIAYSAVKLLHQSGERRFHLLFADVSKAAADEIFGRVASVSRRHLQVMPDNLGTFSLADRSTPESIQSRLAAQLQAWPLPEHQTGHFPALMRRLLRGNTSRTVSL